ncbi:hypothetical protein PsorP6_007139 [Peronosclerospora sorghi]|uniref:Uncharacterized protein n=1 Tax=Peronosclerospora sorghi TaxID=230839 RepID=A0ACC0W8U3_9STRA|nr:hypothetical protein PsorP6_007139 [Peronosclerospora sorghi]
MFSFFNLPSPPRVLTFSPMRLYTSILLTALVVANDSSLAAASGTARGRTEPKAEPLNSEVAGVSSTYDGKKTSLRSRAAVDDEERGFKFTVEYLEGAIKNKQYRSDLFKWLEENNYSWSHVADLLAQHDGKYAVLLEDYGRKGAAHEWNLSEAMITKSVNDDKYAAQVFKYLVGKNVYPIPLIMSGTVSPRGEFYVKYVKWLQTHHPELGTV